MGDDAFHVNTFSRAVTFSILRDTAERQDRFNERIHRFSLFDDEIFDLRHEHFDRDELPQLRVKVRGGSAANANPRANQLARLKIRWQLRKHVEPVPGRHQVDRQQRIFLFGGANGPADLDALAVFDAGHQMFNGDRSCRWQWRAACDPPVRLTDHGGKCAGMTDAGNFDEIAHNRLIGPEMIDEHSA